MIIFYKNQHKAKIFLTKQKRNKQKELLIVFSKSDSLFEYIENKENFKPINCKLYFCDNRFCLLFENKKPTFKACNYIKAHLKEHGKLLSKMPFIEINQAIKSVKRP